MVWFFKAGPNNNKKTIKSEIPFLPLLFFFSLLDSLFVFFVSKLSVMACPRNSITYNATRCACGIGQLLNRSSGSCEIFGWPSTISTDKDVNYSVISFADNLFAFDRIRKFTQSQAVFLEATLVMLLSWLVFCFFLRFTKLGDGRNVWFNLRWWITRLDVFFSTRHWLVSAFSSLIAFVSMNWFF